MTNIMVMFIASISNGLTYTGAIVADNIFWLMPNFSCDFLQYFLNSFSTPTLSDRYVYNGYVFSVIAIPILSAATASVSSIFSLPIIMLSSTTKA